MNHDFEWISKLIAILLTLGFCVYEILKFIWVVITFQVV